MAGRDGFLPPRRLPVRTTAHSSRSPRRAGHAPPWADLERSIAIELDGEPCVRLSTRTDIRTW
jgi:hypothetical protein